MSRGDLPGGDGSSEPAPVIEGVDVETELGRGPDGVVWRARRGPRTVAVKTVPATAGFDRGVLERLVSTESQALSHPNVLEVFSTGEDEDGRVWWTMPLLGGDTLEDILRDLQHGSSERPSLTPLAVGAGGELHPQFSRRCAELFAEVAEGLADAHAAGIVHGRLHSGNLAFSPAGRLVITDFGGAPADADAADDVFALGELLAAVLDAAIDAGLEDIPDGLAACVDKVTSQEEAAGYEDAGAFATDLSLIAADRRPLALAEQRRTRSREDVELVAPVETLEAPISRELELENVAEEENVPADIAAQNVAEEESVAAGPPDPDAHEAHAEDRQDAEDRGAADELLALQRQKREQEEAAAQFEQELERERLARASERARFENESREAARLRRELERHREERRHFEEELKQRELDGRRGERGNVEEAEERARGLEREVALEQGRRARSERELALERRRAERREVEIVRLKEQQEADGSTAPSADLTAAGKKFAFVAAAAIFTTVGLGILAAVQSSRHGAVERHTLDVAGQLETGNFDRARENAQRVAAEEPENGIARATASLVDAVIETAAARDDLGEDMAKAVTAATAREPARAAARVRSALTNIGGLGAATQLELQTLVGHLDQEAARDLVAEGLESDEDGARLLALRQLEIDIEAGTRPASDVAMALRALDPSAPEVFARALRMTTPALGTAKVLERLAIGASQSPVVMPSASFEVLLVELERRDDPHARELLSSWGLRERRALDAAADGGTGTVALPPNVVVRADASARGDHRQRWIAWSARHDTAALLREAPALLESTRLMPLTLDGLVSAASAGTRQRTVAVEITRDLALGDPLRGGRAAVETLARLEAEGALLELAECRSCPVALRRTAIEALPRSRLDRCWPTLRRLVVSSPEPTLRLAAFELLEGSADDEAVAVLPDAVADPDLHDAALAWLRRLPPESCVDEAVELLRHPKGSVRREAVAVLRRVDDPELLLPLTARLFDPDPGVRAASIELLGSKAGALQLGGRPEQLNVLMNDLLAKLGYPFGARAGESSASGPAGVVARTAIELHARLRQAAAVLDDSEQRARWIHALSEKLRENEDE